MIHKNVKEKIQFTLINISKLSPRDKEWIRSKQKADNFNLFLFFVFTEQGLSSKVLESSHMTSGLIDVNRYFYLEFKRTFQNRRRQYEPLIGDAG